MSVGDWIARINEIVAPILAVALIGTAIYMWITGGSVPEELYLLVGMVVGSYFGTKNGERLAQIKALKGGK